MMHDRDIYTIEAPSGEEMGHAFPVIKELRPHLTEKKFSSLIAQMRAEGVQMLVAKNEEGHIVGCAIFRTETRLHTGKMVYLDDLIVSEAVRSHGVGAKLLAAVETAAKDKGAGVLVLDSGTHRTKAHKFYLREGFEITSFNFKKTLQK